MLSENQVERIVAIANQEINLPLLSESHEAKILRAIVQKVNERLDPSMRGFMPNFYVDLVGAVLDDRRAVADKKATVTRLLLENLAQPLITSLNGAINIPVIGEEQERNILTKIVETGITGLVDRSVDALDGLVQAVGSTGGTRDLPAAGGGAPTGGSAQLLSERQMQIIARKVNDSIDIPLLSERREEKIFLSIVHSVNDRLEAALRDHLPGHYVELVRSLLNDHISPDEKKQQVNAVLRGNWQTPLTDAVNRNIDIPLLGEGHETKVLYKVIDYILRGMVHYLVDGMERSDFV
eukprot:TRINITY_DN8852_c0_g1_i3.p1 TRINITY_DN8852_c0_g1~~TRINITY_DN8852_c0_g1_i3.p1  ORF type:complete len:295 (-),score=83.31 TRINITY_DN8852_c0_g1_i3:126-1010(-)